MKTILTALLLVLSGLELMAQISPVAPSTAPPGPPPNLYNNLPSNRLPGTGINPRRQRNNALGTPNNGLPPAYTPGFPPGYASAPAAANAQPEETIPPGMIDFQGVDVSQVLDVYAKLVNRTVLRAALPDAKIVLKTQTPLTKTEAIEALQAVLALNNISVINIGDKFVKVAQSDQANFMGAAINTSDATNLPDLGSYVTHITQLRYVKPSVMVPLITPFAKLPNAVYAIDDNGILVIRDYAENVKRMLEMISKIDVSVPAEYISEVIPIRYAKVEDIASALQSLGGSGGSTVSIGGGTSGGRISGLSGGNTGTGISGFGGGGGVNGYQSGSSGINGFGGAGGSTGSAFGNRTSTANGTATTGGGTFAQRLNNVINQANGGGSSKDQIQLFGQTKIIPDDSSSSLLIFATRQDMVMIKDIISKLDVPLAQVLIEAVIMDVTLGSTFNLGFAAQQNPKAFTGGNITNAVIGGGGFNNGPGILNFLTGSLSGTNSSTATTGASALSSALTPGGGLSYFGNIGPNFDVAVNAAASDNNATVIQRPRIQTSQAKPAQFFVGETVPYVTSTYNGGGTFGNSSSYSQLSVGVELDVTPYINPDGLVVMDIQQEIDDLDGSTPITGVGNVPNTTKRTLNAEMAVRDRDTVMLGGFIRSDKSTARSGVPFLQDIPLLGELFASRADSKDREELIVLMRPTVLKTPELAAENTIKEGQRLPGVSAAAADDASYERSLIDAERKKEARSLKEGHPADGFYNMVMPPEETNNAAPVINDDNTSTTPTNAPVPITTLPTTFPDAPTVTPAQKAALNILLNSFEAGKISRDEYETDRIKILSQSQ